MGTAMNTGRKHVIIPFILAVGFVLLLLGAASRQLSMGEKLRRAGRKAAIQSKIILQSPKALSAITAERPIAKTNIIFDWDQPYPNGTFMKLPVSWVEFDLEASTNNGRSWFLVCRTNQPPIKIRKQWQQAIFRVGRHDK